MKPVYILFATCLSTAALAQTPQLLKDVNVGTGDGVQQLNVVNDLLFFQGNDGIHGSEHWWTDGTTAGTVMLKDLKPGTAMGYGGMAFYFNGKYYVPGFDTASGGYGLLVSDLTASGTHLFKDFSVVGQPASAQKVFEMNGKMFLSTRDTVANQNRLYVSDGTVNNTHLVKNGSFFVGNYFLVMNGAVYFSGTTEVGIDAPYSLWRSDGTEPNTALVKQFEGCARYTKLNNSQFIFNAGSEYFGNEVWISNGTPVGTQLLKDCQPWDTDGNPSGFKLWNNKVYFIADGSQNGINLWSTDGTTPGTSVVAPDLLEGADAGFQPMNGYLYFLGEGANTGNELWRTDGTQAGTTMIADINPGTNWSMNTFYSIVVNDKLYFAADDGVHGKEVWMYDGNTVTMLADLNPGPGSGYYFNSNFRSIGNRVYFVGDNGTTGREIFYFDTTPTGIEEVNAATHFDIYPNPSNDVVNISGQINGAAIRVTDISGKEIFQESTINSDTYSFNIGQYPVGIYIVEVNDDGIISRKKLTKQ